jgi:hypothetical protein
MKIQHLLEHVKVQLLVKNDPVKVRRTTFVDNKIATLKTIQMNEIMKDIHKKKF